MLYGNLLELPDPEAALRMDWADEAASLLLRFDDVVADGIANQLRDRVAFQPPHDVGSMRFRRFDADCQLRGYFLAALPFREKLHDFSLASGQPQRIDVPAFFAWAPRLA
jgi:hypothetical protein